MPSLSLTHTHTHNLWAFTVKSISVIFCNLKKKNKKKRHIYYQCLPLCKLTHSNQHSKHPENGPKIARNLEARWKLFKNA